MYIPADPAFQVERERYALRHTCEECTFFRTPPDGSEPACAHGWPNAEHRRAHYDTAPTLLVFCKEFEIP